MKLARDLFAVLLAAAVSGCADYQAQQQAKAVAQLREQEKAALQECVNKVALTPQTVVARVQCINTASLIGLPTLGNNQDLFRTFMYQRLAIAEQVQSGKLTLAEGQAQGAKRYSEMVSEAQRRNAIAQTAAAQQRAADAAKAEADAQAFANAVAAANLAYAAGLQQSTVRLQTTCTRMGNMTDCF
jgi:hypothetical protein